ncbi:MAG: hypothetical protein ACOC1K_07700 [Nanoarchaeota archaeon]
MEDLIKNINTLANNYNQFINDNDLFNFTDNDWEKYNVTQNKLINSLTKLIDNNKAIKINNLDCKSSIIIISPSAKEKGKIQVTLFANERRPYSHKTFNDSESSAYRILEISRNWYIEKVI